MSQRDYDVMLALARKKQSAFSTALVDGSLVYAYPMNSVNLLEEDLGYVTNENEVGVGEFATRQDQELKDCRLKGNWDLSSWMCAWVAAFGLGTNTPAQQGATAAYEHTSVPITASKQLPVTTIVEKQSAGIKKKVRDIAVARFKISGKIKERLQLEVDLQGSGHTATSTLSMPTLTAGSFLRMHGTQFEIGVAASEVDVSSRVKGFEFEWNNNLLLDDGYHPNSGQVRGRCEHGRRTMMFKLDMLMDANTTEKDHLEGGQALKCIITAVGSLIEDTYYHQLILTIPLLKYKALPIGSEDNMLLYRIESNALYDSGAGYMVQMETMNTETIYLDTEA